MPSPAGPGSGYRATDGAAYERFLSRWTARLAEAFCDFARLAPDGPRSLAATAWAVRGIVA